MNRVIAAICGSLVCVSTWAAVDLNTANQAQLEGVNGIGPSKAKAIIDFRTRNGGFKSVEDLDRVPGFGRATLDRLKGEVSVGPVRAPAPAAAAAPPARPGRK